MQTGPVGQPCRFPFGRVQRLVIDKQAVFIKPECLFELDQNLFRQVVPMLLLVSILIIPYLIYTIRSERR